jgi:hypothetical protein
MPNDTDSNTARKDRSERDLESGETIVERAGYTMPTPHELTREAEHIGKRVRALGDVLAIKGPAAKRVAMARHQIGRLREWLDEAEAMTDAIELAGPDDEVVPALDRHLSRLGNMTRGANGLPSSNVRVAARLANCIELATNLSEGRVPCVSPKPDAAPVPEDPLSYLAIGLAARVHGVANLALELFAESFPDYAVRLDRDAMDRLVTAWLSPSPGRGKWASIAAICKERLDLYVDPTSVKTELATLRRKANADRR